MTKRNYLAAMASTVAFLATGCGGGGGGGGGNSPGAAATVPDSAGASSATYVAYLETLSASDETSDPMLIKSTFAVPADESSDPLPII
jgi:hypothetical protein